MKDKWMLIIGLLTIVLLLNIQKKKYDSYGSFLLEKYNYINGGNSLNMFIVNANPWVYSSISSISISSCQQLTQNGGTYILSQDISGSACVNITGNSIILDCQGHKIIGNNQGNGIHILGDNTMVKNCYVKNFNYGIVSDTEGNTIMDSIFENNVRSGIYLIYPKHITILNSYSYNNWHNDFDMELNSETQCDNTITNLIGSGNKPILYYNHQTTLSNVEAVQIILCNADNSQLNNVKMTPGNEGTPKNRNSLMLYYTDNSILNQLSINKALYSIILDYSTHNTISNSHFDLVQYDHIYFVNSDYNIITLNTFIYNDIDIGSRSGDAFSFFASNNNNIYNNYFYNAEIIPGDDMRIYSGSSNNWGITLTSGANIIGGKYIGGNCWKRASGTGYSQQCTDINTEGICDQAYVLNNVNIEEYPLKC